MRAVRETAVLRDARCCAPGVWPCAHACACPARRGRSSMGVAWVGPLHRGISGLGDTAVSFPAGGGPGREGASRASRPRNGTAPGRGSGTGSRPDRSRGAAVRQRRTPSPRSCAAAPSQLPGRGLSGEARVTDRPRHAAVCRAAGRALSGPGRGPRRPPVRRCRAAVRGTRRTPGGGGARGRLPRGVPVPPRSPSGYAADPGPVIVCPLLRFCAPRVRRVRAPCAHVLCGSRGAVGLVPCCLRHAVRSGLHGGASEKVLRDCHSRSYLAE